MYQGLAQQRLNGSHYSPGYETKNAYLRLCLLSYSFSFYSFFFSLLNDIIIFIYLFIYFNYHEIRIMKRLAITCNLEKGGSTIVPSGNYHAFERVEKRFPKLI